MSWRTLLPLIACVLVRMQAAPGGETGPPSFETDVLPLLRARCVKCHSPAKREANLDLSHARGVAVGGETGAIVDRATPLASLLWKRVAAAEMPPDDPLPIAERQILKRWLAAGAQGLPIAREPGDASHWAFRPLTRQAIPVSPDADRSRAPIDRFLQEKLAERQLSFSPDADRSTLIRRVSFALTGLPPTIDEVEAFVAAARPDAYQQLVEHYLASPHYGERWGKWWLDAAGYADSNGYFNADTDRPLAYRYRDYVVDAFNADKPFDQFLREQLAGDELTGYRPGSEVTPEHVDSLVAMHFLRNAQDGTGESDGNPDELRADRYSVLEGTQQIIGSALLGLTLQCARCHDHKFEPVSQTDYYSLQAVLAGAFDPEHWLKPNEREINTATAAEIAAWETRMRDLDAAIAERRRQFADWARANRPRGRLLFEDRFDSPDELARRWSNTAPGDDAPGGAPPVQIASAAPAAVVQNAALSIVESGAGGNRWLSTIESFDWAPRDPGASVQATFDLVADKLPGDASPAARIGYYVALCDYNDNSDRQGGNLLIDGNPAGGAELHVDYPGADSRAVGPIGGAAYQPGHNYGVRITNSGEGRYLVEHLVDGVAEGKTVTLERADLSSGGFGFEFCCGRSFIVDNVAIEAGLPPASSDDAARYQTAHRQKREELDSAVAAMNRRRTEKPGRTAVAVDVSPAPPDWFLLVRGNYAQRGQKVVPGVPAALCEPGNAYAVATSAGAGSGRRLGLARWLTKPRSRAAALVARVTVNRLWQHHFGTGICSTPDNLGYSGSPPSHPELLDYLAGRLVDSGWSIKRLQREIVLSAAYRQTSLPRDDGLKLDPDNRLLWRFPMRRLDAESVRDAALAVAGELDTAMGGRYVPTGRNAEGEVVVDEREPGAKRRSLYLQQRRTQTLSLLEVFDAPSIVVNCTRRNQATIPLQSLSALNSEFALNRAQGLARRLGDLPADHVVRRAFLLVAGRAPHDDELAAAKRFLKSQPAAYDAQTDGKRQALVDFCQMLLASNAFLYIE